MAALTENFHITDVALTKKKKKGEAHTYAISLAGSSRSAWHAMVGLERLNQNGTMSIWKGFLDEGSLGLGLESHS